jgi:hypothetical protein
MRAVFRPRLATAATISIAAIRAAAAPTAAAE